MDKSILQALNSLIPTLTGPLPPELVELAVSLLAQSRNKASSLKAEEEIARSHACAHLACERLKLSLGLPKIQPRPPCPPRIYQKLYKYLDSALSAGARRSGRPPKQTEAPTSSPAKPRTPAKPSQSKARTPKSRSSHGQQAFASEVPKWVMPLIRHLCRALGAPAAPVHVFAGVSSILTLPAPKPANREGEKAHLEPPNVSALVIVVYLLVGTRLSGAPMPPEEFVRLRTLAIETIRGSGVGKAVEEVSEEASVVAHVTSWMREVSSNSWAELDWFANVPEGGGLSLDGGGENSDGSVGDGDSDWRHTNSMFKHLDVEEAEDETILRPGLGTMMQDRVDYLSERRQLEYQEWKKGILVRIEEMMNAEVMDVSAS